MDKSPLEKLIGLVDFDQKVFSLESSVRKLEKEVSTTQSGIETKNTYLADLEKKVYNVHKDVDAKELEMKTLDEEEKKERVRLDSVTDQRMYESIQKEIDTLKKKQHDLEDSLLESWKLFEQVQKDLAQKKTNIENEIASEQEALQKKITQIDDLKKTIEQHVDERRDHEQGVPEEWLERYATMRNQVSNPIVPVGNGNCSACFYNITQQNLTELRRGKLLQCKDCFRFLYDSRFSDHATNVEEQ